MALEQRTALFNRMDQIGRSVGIVLKAGGKIGSTRDAHRVVYYCQMNENEKDADTATTNALVEKISETYHEREMDISDSDVLRYLAVDAGVSREEMVGWLDASPAVADEEARKNKEEVSREFRFVLSRASIVLMVREIYPSSLRYSARRGSGMQASDNVKDHSTAPFYTVYRRHIQ